MLAHTRGPGELAHPHEPFGAVLVVKADDVVARIADERSLRDDRIALRLAHVEHETHTRAAGADSQQAGALTRRAIEPTDVAGAERCRILADPRGAADYEHEAVVRQRHVLVERRGRRQRDLRQR